MSRSTKTNPKRQALLVLGMHRSGTSALSGVLASLGASAPLTLLPKAKDNPKGFWESAELMRFHDRILASSGSRWNDWEEFNPGWIDSVVAEQFSDLLPSLIEQEFGDARLLLLKDPRMCRFAPFWLMALERMGIAPKVAIPLRRSGEVARSLQVRNGIGPSRSMMLWLRHVLDAESSTRQVPRSFIQYDDLLDNWRGQVKKISEELDIKWPRWSSSVEMEIDDYLSSELRHHQHDDTLAVVGPELRDWLERTAAAVGKLIHTSAFDPEAMAALDEVRLEFGKSNAIYATVVREHENKCDSDVSKLRRELESCSSETATLNAKLGAINQEMSMLSTQNAAHEEARLSLVRDVAQRKVEIDTLEALALERAQLLALYKNDVDTLTQTAAGQVRELLLAKEQFEQELSKRMTELETLRASEKKLLEFRSQADARLTEIKTIVVRLGDENRELNVRDMEQTRSLEERYKEIAKLTKLDISKEREALEHRVILERKIALQESELDKHRQEISMMRRHWSWRMGGPIRRINRMLRGERPAGDQAAQDASAIRESEWFDAAWYSGRYPDVAASGMDPVLHYLEFGALEGRDPGPRFDTNFYLKTYTDVAESGVNPLLHFIQYGRSENRKPR